MSQIDRSPRRWLITGVSSGLGRALAEYALEQGDVVIGTLRQENQLAGFAGLAAGRAFPVRLDVTDDAAVGPVLGQAIAAAGGIDVCVNNAGYALAGAVEDLALDEVRLQFETNVYSIIRTTQAVAPHMREQGRGHIINIASVAGATAFPVFGAYCASKFAVVGLSAALAKELAPFGVRVTAIEPGGFRTKFGGTSLHAAGKTSAPYEKITALVKTRMASFDQAAPNDPRKGAAAIYALTEMADPPVHAALGADGLKMVRDALAARLADYDRAPPLLTNTDAD